MIESKARTVARTYINVNSFNYLDWLDFNPRVFPRRTVAMDPRKVPPSPAAQVQVTPPQVPLVTQGHQAP